MPEPQGRESLGSRLLAVGQPQEAAWNRYKTRMEGTMTELETRTRKFKRLRWVPLSVSIVLIVLATVFLVRSAKRPETSPDRSRSESGPS